MEVLRQDHDWLMWVGVLHIVDKLIKHPEFTGGVGQIRHAAFVAGEESSHAGLKLEIDFGTNDLEVNDSRSSHIAGLDDSFLSYDTLDCSHLLGLG